MSRSAPMFSKPRAGKLSPNKKDAKPTTLRPGATRDVIAAANAVLRRREWSEDVSPRHGGRA